MQWLLEIVQSPDFWKIAFPALAAVVAWYWNERTKLVAEQFRRKEESYKELIRCLRGFYADSQDPKLKSDFLNQVNLCWLYASDDVIRKAYEFLGSVHTGAKSSDEEKENFCRQLVHAIRSDILSRKPLTSSSLAPSEFRHL
jgi:hypothetical protein